MFLAICETGGVAGYNACDEFTGVNPTVDTICDHLFHFLELDPTGKHIALGGDLDGVTKMPEGFDGVQSWPVLAQRLQERGMDAAMIDDIFWNNALGVMKRAVCNHAG
jgi:membrane dipeptidase